MATIRKIAFKSGYFYHIFNRGIEGKTVFTTKREFIRAKRLIKFYRHKETPIRYSQLMQQPTEIRDKVLKDLYKSERLIDILSYCLMPNHFHFLVKQTYYGGVAKFISNLANAYTKYFNTKYQRLGPLFQGVFKAVIIESEEQLIHVSRYIHLNPVVSSIIEDGELENYPWSSYMEYLDLDDSEITQKELIMDIFKSKDKYKQFVIDQIDYGKKLEEIKHLIME